VLLKFVASRLRELRKRHELTQEQMALLLGTDVKWYQRIEWSEKDIRASTIERLAAVFGVSPIEFLAAETPETRVRETPQNSPHRLKKRRVTKKGAKR
jgi:transcriptional regulator with XRE-family HTH domain